MKKIVSLALTAAAASAAIPAAAQTAQISPDGSYRIAVHYSDLNLANDAGTRTLEQRLKAATNMVCGAARVMTPNEFRNQNACRASIAENARPKIALVQRAARGGLVVAEGR